MRGRVRHGCDYCEREVTLTHTMPDGMTVCAECAEDPYVVRTWGPFDIMQVPYIPERLRDNDEKEPRP